MHRKYSYTLFLLPFIFFLQTSLIAQQNKTENIIEKQPTIERINLLNDLAWECTKDSTSLPISLTYAYDANQKSKKIKYKEGLATSYYRLGHIYFLRKDLNKAELNLIKSLNIERKIKNQDNIAKVTDLLGSTYRKLGYTTKALHNYNEAIEIYQVQKDSPKIASIYNKMGLLFKNEHQYTKAIKYYAKENKIRISLQKPKKTITTYINLGYCYNKSSKYNSALYELEKGKQLAQKHQDSSQLATILLNMGQSYQELKKLDTALSYYKKSFYLKEQLKLNKTEILLNNIGAIYQDQKDYSNAIKFYKKSIDYSNKINDSKTLSLSYYNIGNVFLKTQQYTKALDYHQKALKIATKQQNIHLKLQILMSIAEDYEQLGDFKKSSKYNEQHIVLRDSIDIDLLTKIDDETLELKKDVFDKNIEIQTAKEQQDKLKLHQSKLKLYGTIAFSIAIGILFFAILWNYRLKKSTIIERQENQLKKAELEELLKKQELKSIHAMIDGQEQERKRIAQDLHDRLGSMLSMVKIHYKAVEDNLDKLKIEAKEQYDRANILLDEACVAVREISHNMISGVLTKFGLIAALNELKSGLESTNTLQVELIDHGFDNRIDNHIEINIYRIIQELISNTIKHANATEISIQLLKRDNALQIMIEDDGVGFDTEVINHYAGIGLKGILSRVQNLHGTIDFDSKIEHGTTVTIDIPLQYNTNNL